MAGVSVRMEVLRDGEVAEVEKFRVQEFKSSKVQELKN
jgi:hypothetical protein